MSNKFEKKKKEPTTHFNVRVKTSTLDFLRSQNTNISALINESLDSFCEQIKIDLKKAEEEEAQSSKKSETA